jgi:outer membrane biosynthesis protein TonB/putative methionine-R-sulfoxide reductase with GAF domain
MGSAQGPVTSELELTRGAPEFGAHTPASEKLLAVAIRAQNFTGSTGIAIALTEGQEVVCRASWGTSAPEVGTRLSLEHSFTGLCMRSGEPVRCDDAQNDTRVDAEACRALGISAIAAAPVRRGLKVIGVIAAFSDTPNAFTDKHLLILSTLADVVVEILDDPNPGQPLAQSVEAAPDRARAAAVVRVPVTSPTLTTPAPRLRSGQAPGAAPTPLVDKAVLKPAISESTSPPAKPEHIPADSAKAPNFSTPDRNGRLAKAPPKQRDRVSDFESPRKQDDILPAAMDPGPPAKPKSGLRAEDSKTSIAGSRARPQSARATPAPDTGHDLRFSGLESAAGSWRRWLLPAALVAILLVIGRVGWRWYAAKRAVVVTSAPAPTPAQTASQEPQPAPQPVAAESIPAEPRHSPFSPPPMASSILPPTKAARASEPRVNLPIRRTPQPMVETTAPVRRPAESRKAPVAALEATEAPALTPSAPDLPPTLGQPTAAPVAGPISHMVPAELLQRVQPVFPEAAHRMQVSSKVVVKATITKFGIVGNIRWVSGNELFRDSTLNALKQWRYRPASLNGEPVDSEVEIVLQYNRPTPR